MSDMGQLGDWTLERQEAAMKALTMPIGELIEALPEEEQERYRRSQQSIVDAAIWLRPRREW